MESVRAGRRETICFVGGGETGTDNHNQAD